MVKNQGDVFWIDFDEPTGSEPEYRHPHVVVQNNLFNRSRFNTVIAYFGTLSNKRISQIISGIRLIAEPREVD